MEKAALKKLPVGIEIIEVKYADQEKCDAACQEALNQIKEKNYTRELQEDGCSTICQYGIACHKKACRVTVETDSVA